MKIYVKGTGGLGNSLFQIMTAVFYKEKFPQHYDEIILSDNQREPIHFGTSREFNKDKARGGKNGGEKLSYKYTIFSKFKFEPFDLEQIPHIDCFNAYTNTIYNPIQNINIHITGYNQNRDLFKDVLHCARKYLNLDDREIMDSLKEKYPELWLRPNIMVGVRAGYDFPQRLGSQYYTAAISAAAAAGGAAEFNIVAIADHAEKVGDFIDGAGVNLIIIDEDDITQIYAGLLCDYFVLSESSFHYWIAALKCADAPDTKVFYPRDSDPQNYHWVLDSWIGI